jgi:cysteine desulfurase
MLYVKRGSDAGKNRRKIERRGTENVAGIAGFAEALAIADATREKESARLAGLRNFFFEGLKKINPAISANGGEPASPHILNVSIPGIDNEFFVLQLDARGVECSTKSACLRDLDESYVLSALGSDSKTSVRFSFGRDTTKSLLKKTLSIIAKTLPNSYN